MKMLGKYRTALALLVIVVSMVIGLGYLKLEVERINSRLNNSGVYEIFFKNSKEYFQPIVEIRTEKFIGTGFFINDSVLVTVGHVADAPEVEIFPTFLEATKVLVVSEPVLSEDGLLAFYRLSAQDSAWVRKHQIKYFEIADMKKVYPGDPAFRLAINKARWAYGSLVGMSVIEDVAWEKGYLYQAVLDVWPAELLYEYSRSIRVPGGVSGDSGSPVLVFDENRKKFVLAGITNTPDGAIRADILAEFLKENGVLLE